MILWAGAIPNLEAKAMDGDRGVGPAVSGAGESGVEAQCRPGSPPAAGRG